MNYWKVLKRTFKEFIENDPMSHSASIAFYTIFSLPAILIIVVSIAGTAYEDQLVRDALLTQVRELFGEDSATSVEKIMENVTNLGATLFKKIIGIATLIFSATTVFASLQNSINKIWKVRPKANKEIKSFFIKRVLSLAMVVSVGFLMLVSLVIDTFIAVLNRFMNQLFSEGTYYIITGINLLLSLAIITLIFAMIFKVLPDVRMRWRDVWVGAFVTTVLFIIGKYLIGFYLGNSTLSNAYGAAGSYILLLIWVYYSSLILLFGAQFTHVYATAAGHRVRLQKYAVRIEVVEREE